MIRDRLWSSPLVAQTLEEHPEFKDDSVGMLQYLEERGLIEEIFASLEAELQQPQPFARLDANVKPARLAAEHITSEVHASPSKPASSHQLRLTLQTGMAFLDFLEEPDTRGRKFCWHVAFGRQRLRSRSVPASVDPRFDEVLYLELPANASRSSLLLHAVPIHLVLTVQSEHSEEPTWSMPQSAILCSHYLEWRRCLAASGPLKLTEELKGAGRRHQLSAGVLHAELELLPPGPVTEVLPEVGVSAQLKAEELRGRHDSKKCYSWWTCGRDFKRTMETPPCISKALNTSGYVY